MCKTFLAVSFFNELPLTLSRVNFFYSPNTCVVELGFVLQLQGKIQQISTWRT